MVLMMLIGINVKAVGLALATVGTLLSLGACCGMLQCVVFGSFPLRRDKGAVGSTPREALDLSIFRQICRMFG